MFTVSMNTFDYLGAIFSYLIIAIAVFGGMYDSMSVTELSAQISRVCCYHACTFISPVDPISVTEIHKSFSISVRQYFSQVRQPFSESVSQLASQSVSQLASWSLG